MHVLYGQDPMYCTSVQVCNSECIVLNALLCIIHMCQYVLYYQDSTEALRRLEEGSILSNDDSPPFDISPHSRSPAAFNFLPEARSPCFNQPSDGDRMGYGGSGWIEDESGGESPAGTYSTDPDHEVAATGVEMGGGEEVGSAGPPATSVR